MLIEIPLASTGQVYSILLTKHFIFKLKNKNLWNINIVLILHSLTKLGIKNFFFILQHWAIIFLSSVIKAYRTVTKIENYLQNIYNFEYSQTFPYITKKLFWLWNADNHRFQCSFLVTANNDHNFQLLLVIPWSVQ